MWGIEYVQVPIAKEKVDEDEENSSATPAAVPRIGCGAASSSVAPMIKSESNCSLATDDEPSVKEDETEDGNDDSVKDELDDESPTKVRMALNVQLQQKRPSLVSAKSLHEQINNIVLKGKGT